MGIQDDVRAASDFAGDVLGQPHVQHRGRARADRVEAALDGWADLVGIGDLLAVGAAGGGFA